MFLHVVCASSVNSLIFILYIPLPCIISCKMVLLKYISLKIKRSNQASAINQSFLLLSNGYEFEPSNHRRHKYTDNEKTMIRVI